MKIVTRIAVLTAMIAALGTTAIYAQTAGLARGKLGEAEFEGAVSCELGEVVTIVTPDGGRADNDGDGFALRLSGDPTKGFWFTIVVGDRTYTGNAQGGIRDDKLLIVAPELNYLDGNGVVPTTIEVECGG